MDSHRRAGGPAGPRAHGCIVLHCLVLGTAKTKVRQSVETRGWGDNIHVLQIDCRTV